MAASGLGAACFCYVAGGNIWDSLAAFAAGLLLYVFILWAEKRERPMSKIVLNIARRFSGDIFICCFVQDRAGQQPECDCYRGHHAAAARGILCYIDQRAGGFQLYCWLCQDAGYSDRDVRHRHRGRSRLYPVSQADRRDHAMIMTVLFQFIAACFGTVAFSIMFYVPREYYLYCGLIGGGGWVICWSIVNYLNFSEYYGDFYSHCLCGVFVESLRNRTEMSGDAVLCSRGSFRWCPGVGIYWTVYSMIMGDMQECSRYGRQTLCLAAAIVPWHYLCV